MKHAQVIFQLQSEEIIWHFYDIILPILNTVWKCKKKMYFHINADLNNVQTDYSYETLNPKFSTYLPLKIV